MLMATDTQPTVMATDIRPTHTATAMARVTVMEVMGMLITRCVGMFMPLITRCVGMFMPPMVSDIAIRLRPS
jgi:hypothetical protein